MRRGLYYTLKHLYATARKCDYSRNIALLNFNMTTYQAKTSDISVSIKYKINHRYILVVESETWESLSNMTYSYFHAPITIAYTWRDTGNNKTSHDVLHSEFINENGVSCWYEGKVSFTI